MSSPLGLFRKYQKILLAVFGVMLMIAFVVVPSVMQFLSRQETSVRAAGDSVVVAWRGKDVTEDDLQSFRFARTLTLQYLEAIARQAVERDKRANPPGVRVQRDNDGEVVGVMVNDLGIGQDLSDRSLVEAMILGRQASDTGLVISDDAIIEFLRQRTDEVLTNADLASALRSATNGRLNETQLFDHLRSELLARRMRDMAFSGLYAMSPAAAWDYHNRLFRNAKLEIAPLRIADLTAKITRSPADADLKTLYEKHKDQFPFPDSPDPGFKQRKQLAFQYVKIQFDKLLESEKAQVTDEQVKEYYDENLENFKQVSLPPAASETPPPESGGGETPGEQPDKGDGEPFEETPESTKSDGSAAKPASGGETQVETGSESSSEPETEVPPGEDSDAGKNAEPAESNGAAPADSDGVYEVDPADAKHFVSLQDEEQPAKSGDDAPADTNAGATAEEAGQEQPGEQSQADEPATSEGAATEAESTTDSQVKDESGKESTTEAATETEKGEEKEAEEEPQYKPLEEVADEIRRSLARPKAQEKMDQVVDKLRGAINDYSRKLVIWQSFEAEDLKNVTSSPVEKPEPVDVEAVLQKYQVELKLPADAMIVGQTPLVDSLEIGQSAVEGDSQYGGLGDTYQMSFAGGQFRQIYFHEIAFQDDIPLFLPSQPIQSQLDVYFVYWRTEQRDEYVPEFKEAREAVVQAWKKQEAFNLAQQRATELAAKASAALAASSGQSMNLKSALAGEKDLSVVETNEFTWMTMGALPSAAMAPRTGDVALPEAMLAKYGQEVETVGQDFMKSVFAAADGGVGVAHNLPQSFVYVFRVLQFTPSEEERRQQFLDSGPTYALYSMAAQDRQQVYQRWYEQLEQEMKVEWKRPAEKPTL